MSNSPTKHQEPNKDGNMPQYITQVPWYVDNKSSSEQALNHQKFPGQSKKADINDWYERGKKGLQATTYRKGACDNCGALGHARKECTQRPRKTGARFDARGIAADDIKKSIALTWEAKRDRWMGFDPGMHKEIVADEYEVYEEIKKKRKVDGDGDVDADAEFKDSANPIDVAHLPSKSDPISIKIQGLSGIRNREDFPNYLLNLDTSSALYHPKSRTMSENPNPLLPEDRQTFKGHNSYLNSGEQVTLQEMERFVQQQAELQNSELNPIALPSLTEHVYRTVKRKNQMLNSGRTGQLLKKYGGSEYIQNKPQQIAQSEGYVEYQRTGKPKVQAGVSRYPQNVYTNDHTSVWGSWWNQQLGWGYFCCHGSTKMSMCSGSRGHELALQREMRVKKEKLRKQIEQKIKAEKEEQV